MLPDDSSVQARSRPGWPIVPVCSVLRGFPGLGTLGTAIGTVQANWDETHCFARRQPWSGVESILMTHLFPTESPFHVGNRRNETGRVGAQGVNSASWVSPPEVVAAVCPDGLSVHHARHFFDSCMWAFAEREATHTLSSHTFVFSLWGVISKPHSLWFMALRSIGWHFTS